MKSGYRVKPDVPMSLDASSPRIILMDQRLALRNQEENDSTLVKVDDK